MAKEYLDKDGLLYFWQKIKNLFVSDVNYDSTNKKITKTKAGSTSDVVAISTIKTDLSLTKSDVGLGNVDNTSDANKPISTATQTALNGKAASSHTHGNITNAGALQTNDVTIANGDKLVITDASDSNKVARASVAFDGSTATKALTQKGTFETFNNYTHPSYTAATAAAVKVGRDATGHVVIGDALAKGDVGLGNVDNTADANKSVASAGKLTTAANIDGVDFDGSSDIIHYGTCSTPAGTVAKVVNCAGFKLITGAIIYVKFTVTNSGAVANLTLNVNGTGAKNIKYRNANLSSAGVLAANRVYCFVYDGTYYQLVGDLDTNSTYSNASLGQGYGTCATKEATAAKVVTLSNYALTVGGVVAVKFSYAVPAEATLNINSKGAKNIFYKGAKITAGVIEANDVVTFMYDGTQYHLLTIDRAAKIPLASHFENGLMSAEDKERLDLFQIVDPDVADYYIVALDNENYLVPAIDSSTGQIFSSLVPSDSNKVDKVAGKGLSTNDFTDTLKSKLNGIASGAEVNQNAFSNVKVGTTTVAADAKTDTLELAAGSNVTLTPDATNDKITIAATDTVYTHPTYTARTGKPTANATPSFGGTFTVSQITSDSTGHVTGATDRTVTIPSSVATDSAAGLMSAEDHSLLTNMHSEHAELMLSALVYTDSGSSSYTTYGRTITDPRGDTTDFVISSKVGAASGICPLNASSKIDAQYLPSYVDDIIEAYARSGQTALSSTWLATGSASGTVITPETGKIYVLMADSGDYSANTQFRWSGTAYVKLNDGGVSAITNSEIDTIVAS